MKLGTFYEHQLPRPWKEGSELKLFKDALDQVELADKLGIDHMWEVEHHFLEEYAHSSAPEIFLAAASLGGIAGLLGLVMFILGLLVMNTLMCAAAAGMFSATLAHPGALRALTLVTSAYSIVVGAIFLLGSADRLPSLTGLTSWAS